MADKLEKVKKLPTIRQFNEYDGTTGELIRTVTMRQRPTKFGRGWIMTNKQAQLKLIKMVSPLAVTVAMLIGAKQNYNDFVLMSKQWIADELGMSRQTIYRAITELQEANWLKVINVEGNTGFLLNPTATACGQSALKSRMQLWTEETAWERITDKTVSLVNDISDPTIIEDEDFSEPRMR